MRTYLLYLMVLFCSRKQDTTQAIIFSFTNQLPFCRNTDSKAHIGKWHLGGLTPSDIISRNNPYNSSCNSSNPGDPQDNDD